MKDRPELPGYLLFLWMFWMQPITLHSQLQSCGIDKPGDRGLALWGRRKIEPAIYRYLGRLALTLVASPLVVIATWWFFSALAEFPRQHSLAGHLIVGLGFGVIFGVLSGMVIDLAFAVALGAALAASLGVAEGPTLGVVSGVAAGMAAGVAVSMAFAVPLGAWIGVAASIILVSASGLKEGAAFGTAFGVAFSIGYFRLPIYPVELVATLSLSWLPGSSRKRLSLLPVFFHDLSWLPLPFPG